MYLFANMSFNPKNFDLTVLVCHVPVFFLNFLFKKRNAETPFVWFLGGGFKYFYFHPDPYAFQIGLVQPPTRKVRLPIGFYHLYTTYI